MLQSRPVVVRICCKAVGRRPWAHESFLGRGAANVQADMRASDTQQIQPELVVSLRCEGGDRTDGALSLGHGPVKACQPAL
jgi:hypothetical protein